MPDSSTTNTLPRYARRNLGQCWKCQHQTDEHVSAAGKSRVILPVCEKLHMAMTGLFRPCEHFIPKGGSDRE